MSKRFGALAAVDDVDLDIRSGETIGIGGPNGAGKTTFFDLISGLSPLSGGDITFKGRSVADVAPHRLLHRGMARTFQLNSGFDGMTVFDNILAAQVFGRRSAGGVMRTKQADLDAATAMLEETGLASIADEHVAGIPILARKKLMVATALVNEPELLLLDEPVGGLTPSEIDEFITMMMKLKDRGMTLVFIEHVMRFLITVAERAIIMHQGQIIYDGLPKDLSDNATVANVYLGSATINPSASAPS